MPTLSKPRLKEPRSIWRTPSVGMRKELNSIKPDVLERLGFYCEHGRPEDFGSKYKKQVHTNEKEVLSEILGALTIAYSILNNLSRPVLIATLKKIQQNPSLIHRKTLPTLALWSVAQYYQRRDERPGTFWPDIMGERPANFPGRRKKPIPKKIETAASAAVEQLQINRKHGRPANAANAILAEKLGGIFRRYNGDIVRHSLDSARGSRPLQIDGGPFFDFVHLVTTPLRSLLRKRNFKTISPSGVVGEALKIQSNHAI
jgi:hypothetical protein